MIELNVYLPDFLNSVIFVMIVYCVGDDSHVFMPDSPYKKEFIRLQFSKL